MRIAGRRTRLVVGSLTALTLALTAACSDSDDEKDAGKKTDRPAGIDFEAPSAEQVATGVQLGDQTAQSLNAVAAKGRTVVAGGWDESYNTQLALFVHSTDAGQTWERAEIDRSDDAAVGNEYVGSVAAGKGGFVATGQGGDNRPAVWTSKDGSTWTSVELEDEVVKRNDSFSRLRYLDGRYHLVGTNPEPCKGATQQLVLWTSDDGTSWERNELCDKMQPVTGTPSVADIALHQDQLVLAGGIEDASFTQQPDRLAIWRSTDQGKTFRQDDTPRDLGGDFRAYAVDLVVHNGALFLAASGDGSSQERFDESSWDAVVVVDRGDGWRKVVDHDFSTRVDDHPAALVSQGKRLVLAASTDEDDALVGVGPDAARLAPVRHPSLRADRDQTIQDAAVTGGATTLVGSTDETGSEEAAVWRLVGKKVVPVELPEEVRVGRPSTQLVDVVNGAGGYVAVGGSTDSPVVWSSTDFADWRATGLDGRRPGVSSVYVTTAATRDDGTAIVLGFANRGNGTDGLAWLQGPKGAWQLLQPPGLTNRNDQGYGAVVPQDVAVKGRTIVAAGFAHINGQYDAHPVVSTDNGRSWRPGRGTSATELSDTERYVRRTRWQDFRSPANGSLQMLAVSATKSGWVIGGHRQEAGAGSVATAWTSADGRTWSAPRQLQQPDGIRSSRLTDLVANGSTVVAVGSVAEDTGHTTPGWASWVSSDGGRTWQTGQVVATAETTVADLLEVPGGYLALGSKGKAGRSDAAAWTSKDGRSWTEIELDLPRGDGPGSQALLRGLVGDKKVRMVARDVPPAGGGLYAAEIDVPKP